jgi:glycosyltransferase involved in cell wall biosynthesis
MSRLYIVDQNALAVGGHYFSYTSCIAEAARDAGLEVVLLTNRKLRDAFPTKGMMTIPAFIYSWVEANQFGTLDWREGNIAFELAMAFRRVPPTAEDHVLVHSLGERELRALLAYLVDGAAEEMPTFHLILRYDTIHFEYFARNTSYFSQIMASTILSERIHFHTDTELLSRELRDLTGVPFTTLPIPFSSVLLLGNPGSPDPASIVTAVYLGDARNEKGYQHLAGAAHHLWASYLKPNRLRLIVQSNFNIPEGEPGIPESYMKLSRFPSYAVQLITEPLPSTEYYKILSSADIVLIPYSPEAYRFRSSGILVEALAAGKVIVTSSNSWMATQVTPESAVLFSDPGALGAAIEEAVESLHERTKAARARQLDWQAFATGANFIQHLLDDTGFSTRVSTVEDAPRILYIMDGGAMVLHDGSAQVARLQLQYLRQAGYRVIGLFVTYDRFPDDQAFLMWVRRLNGELASFELERVFVVGPAQWSMEIARLIAARDRKSNGQSSFEDDLLLVNAVDLNLEMVRFLRSKTIDVVYLNYAINYPLVEGLGLAQVPVICEMHHIHSFQRAIYDEHELETELALLQRCDVLISLNEIEAAFVQEKLPGKNVINTGIFLSDSPDPVRILAGMKNISDIISSSLPAVSDDARVTNDLERLAMLDSIDVLFVSSAHVSNVKGMMWFLEEVYLPYLEPCGYSFVVAGSICDFGPWPMAKRLFFVGPVGNLDPLYVAARVVCLPVLEDTGVAVKLFEALRYGCPVVATTEAVRAAGDKIQGLLIRDDPLHFGSAVIDLLSSPERRAAAAAVSADIFTRHCHVALYTKILNDIFSSVLGERSQTIAIDRPSGLRKDPRVEWSPCLRAINGTLRALIQGDPLELGTLSTLAHFPEAEIAPLWSTVVDALVTRADAALLSSNPEMRSKVMSLDTEPDLAERLLSVVRFAIAESDLDGSEKRAAIGLTLDRVRVILGSGIPTCIGVIFDHRVTAASDIRVNDVPVSTKWTEIGDRPIGVAYWSPKNAKLARLTAVDLSIASKTRRRHAPAPRSGDVRPQAWSVVQKIPARADSSVLNRLVFADGWSFGQSSDVYLLPGSVGHLNLPRIGLSDGILFFDFVFDRLLVPAPLLSIKFETCRLLVNQWVSGDTLIYRATLESVLPLREFGLFTMTAELGGQGTRYRLRLREIRVGAVAGLSADRAVLAAAQPPNPAGERAADMAASRRGLIGRIISAWSSGRRVSPLDAAAFSTIFPTGFDQSDIARSIIEAGLAQTSSDNGSTPPPIGQGGRTLPQTVGEQLRALLSPLPSGGREEWVGISPALTIDFLDEEGQLLKRRTGAVGSLGRSWIVGTQEFRPAACVRCTFEALRDVTSAEEAIEAYGFHYAENDGDQPFRWTGPGHKSIVFLPILLTRRAILDIDISDRGRNVRASDINLVVNEVPVPHESTGDRLTATIEPPAKGGMLSIGLYVTQLFKPGSGDERVLGIAVRTLTLTIDLSATGSD